MWCVGRCSGVSSVAVIGWRFIGGDVGGQQFGTRPTVRWAGSPVVWWL